MVNTRRLPIEPAALPLVVRAGGGSVRDTLSVLDQLIGGADPDGVTYELAVALLWSMVRTLSERLRAAIAAKTARDSGLTVEPGQVLVMLVTAPGEKFERDYFVEVLRRFPEVRSIHWAVNEQPSEVTNLPSRLLWGEEAIEEEILGLRFRLRPNAFMQTNTAMCEVLYRLAAEYAGLTGEETVYDLYCGTGTIALTVARDVRLGEQRRPADDRLVDHPLDGPGLLGADGPARREHLARRHVGVGQIEIADAIGRGVDARGARGGDRARAAACRARRGAWPR